MISEHEKKIILDNFEDSILKTVLLTQYTTLDELERIKKLSNNLHNLCNSLIKNGVYKK